jgi:hypothetical protein
MVNAIPMNEDDDVERLFSWLQTPELRYREFAGAREITDSVVTWQARLNTPSPAGNAPVVDVRTENDYRPADTVRPPVATQPVATQPAATQPAARGPVPVAVVPVTPPVAAPVSTPGGPFALGASGRGIPRYPEYTEPVAPPVPPPPELPPPIVSRPAPPAAPVLPPPPSPVPETPAAAGSGLLGGAYRDSGIVPEPAPPPAPSLPQNQQRDERSLDAVFGRLAGGRDRLPDPRDRLRHIPGLGPPAGRPR